MVLCHTNKAFMNIHLRESETERQRESARERVKESGRVRERDQVCFLEFDCDDVCEVLECETIMGGGG